MTESHNAQADPLPASSGRRERKRAETRERIFRAAMELFANRGFFATTVEDITHAADVGKGTFFNYFPSKEHVLGVLHEIQLGKVSKALALAEAGQTSTREVLRRFMRSIAEEPGRSQLLARGLLATIFSSEPIRELLVGTMAQGRQMLEKILALGQQRGEVRRDISVEEMARAFQQTVLGSVLLWSLGSPATLAKTLYGTFEVYWTGVSAKTTLESKDATV